MKLDKKIYIYININTYEQVAPVKLGLQVPPFAQKLSGQTAIPQKYILYHIIKHNM